MECDPRTSHSGFGGDPGPDLDPGFLNLDTERVHTAVVSSPLCSPDGSCILGGDLCCPGTDFLIIFDAVVGDLWCGVSEGRTSVRYR